MNLYHILTSVLSCISKIYQIREDINSIYGYVTVKRYDSGLISYQYIQKKYKLTDRKNMQKLQNGLLSLLGVFFL